MSDLTVHTAVDIAAPASEVWQLFGEGFADWADWAPGIDASSLEGPLAEGVVRVNQTASLGTVRQELVRFDREARALAYEMRSTLPPMFSAVRNDWTVAELEGGGSRLSGEAVFALREQAEPMRGKLAGKMGMALQVFAESVRTRVEGGAS